jgi:hypothetical protein
MYKSVEILSPVPQFPDATEQHDRVDGRLGRMEAR